MAKQRRYLTPPKRPVPTIGTARVPLEEHDLVSDEHTASALTVGYVIRATAATTFAWQQLQHTDLGMAGSSLADHATRSAGDLTSGNLAIARMPTGGAWSLTSDLNIDSNTLVVDIDVDRVGIGTATPPDTLSVTGAQLITHVSILADDHALEIDVDAAGYGDVKALDIFYDTGAIAAGEDEGVILINIDETAATGGDLFGVEVLATDGGAGIYGLKAGALVGPIHQDSGTFANPTTGTDNTPSTDVPAMIDGSTGTTTAIFENDDEYIIIGAAAAFQEIEFILTTSASNPGIKPTFWYSTVGTGQFTQFTPVDGTNGFRNTGVVAWDASDLTGHVADDVTGTFDIKIIRTQNVLGTSPVLGYAKVAATTEYIWDKSANVTIATLRTTTLAADTLLLQAYDVDGSAYTTFATLTANNTPTMDLAASVTLAGNAIATTNLKLSDFAATTSAELAGVISNETGSGALVFANTPTLVTPVLGAATATSIDFGTTTLLASRALTVDTGGVFNIVLGSAAGDDFAVDTDKLVVEGDTGNVGIGTTGPSSRLDIATGYLNFTDGYGILFGGNNNVQILGNSALDRIEFQTNTTSRVLIDSAGDVDVYNTLKVDTIAEHTGAAGVTIDGVLLKDNDIHLIESGFTTLILQSLVGGVSPNRYGRVFLYGQREGAGTPEIMLDAVVVSLTVDGPNDRVIVQGGFLDLATGLRLATDKPIQFRDPQIYLASLNDGYLDIVADAAIRLTGNVGIGGTPGTKFEVNLGGASQQSAINLLSGGAGNYVSYGLGRTAEEAGFGVAAAANHFATGSAAGDAIIYTSGGALHLGAESGAAAALVLSGGNLVDPILKGPIHDVRAYGAKTDEAACYADEIQAAMDAAAATRGIALIPTGTWRIDKSLIVRYDVSVWGVGARHTSIKPTTNHFPAFTNYLNPTYYWSANFSIRNLQITYINHATYQNPHYYPSNNTEDCGFKFFGLNYPREFRIENVRIYLGYYGYYDTSGSYMATLSLVEAIECRNGFYKNAGTTFHFENCYAVGNASKNHTGLNYGSPDLSIGGDGLGWYIGTCYAFTLTACALDLYYSAKSAHFNGCHGLVLNAFYFELNKTDTTNDTVLHFQGCEGLTVNGLWSWTNHLYTIAANESSLVSVQDCVGAFQGAELGSVVNDDVTADGADGGTNVFTFVVTGTSFITVSGCRIATVTLAAGTLTGDRYALASTAAAGSSIVELGCEILNTAGGTLRLDNNDTMCRVTGADGVLDT